MAFSNRWLRLGSLVGMKRCPEILSLVPAPGWSVHHRTSDGRLAEIPLVGWALCTVASAGEVTNEVLPLVPAIDGSALRFVEPLILETLPRGDIIELFFNGELVESVPQKFRQLALL